MRERHRSRFSVKLQRDPGRRNLVTRRDYAFNVSSIYWYSTGFDLLGRPTNATDSVSLVRTWLYNRRSELAAAQIGTNSYGYAYDTIGNRQWSSANSYTNSYTANSLNQYSSISTLRASVAPCELVYDADGNLVRDDRFTYAYDAENRMLSARPIAPSEGDLAVVNAYGHKHRRIMKRVERFDGDEWQTSETHTLAYDGGNIVLERITFADGTIRICEYFWGNDLSGTEQGAGGVGGLLAVSIDGTYFIPCYDHNGNIVCYVSESGTIAAQYVYDPYGNVIEQYGALAGRFAIRFSTKYTDLEISLISYLRRFYRPDHGRWLNRDPIEEDGGENLYVFCMNSPCSCFDVQGTSIFSDIANVISAISSLKAKLDLQLSQLGECLTVVREWYPGGKRDSQLNDKYRHCLASCEISKACGAKLSVALGLAKEMSDLIRMTIVKLGGLWDDGVLEAKLDAFLGGGEYYDSLLDLEADGLGILSSFKEGDCKCLCKKQYVP